MGADYNGPNVGPLNSYQSSLSEFGDENLSTLEDIAGKATWLVCMALDADFNHLKRIQQMTKRPVVVGQMPKLRVILNWIKLKHFLYLDITKTAYTV